MKVGILYSGGKDSTFAMYKAKQEGHEICCLVSLKSKNDVSYMFHTPNIDLVSLQAEALEIPLLLSATDGIKEKELEDLKKALAEAKEKYSIEGVVSGALFSDYQKDRVDRICEGLGLQSIAPLWHTNQAELLKEMMDSDFEIKISRIAADGLSEWFLGKTIEENVYNKLLALHEKNGCHIAGEGGEYESLVVDCPLFKKKLVVEDASVVMENEYTGSWVVKHAVLRQKT
jgi:diphthine-ammonia ligase